MVIKDSNVNQKNEWNFEALVSTRAKAKRSCGTKKLFFFIVALYNFVISILNVTIALLRKRAQFNDTLCNTKRYVTYTNNCFVYVGRKNSWIFLREGWACLSDAHPRSLHPVQWFDIRTCAQIAASPIIFSRFALHLFSQQTTLPHDHRRFFEKFIFFSYCS